jgi:hypothetical protein
MPEIPPAKFKVGDIVEVRAGDSIVKGIVKKVGFEVHPENWGFKSGRPMWLYMVTNYAYYDEDIEGLYSQGKLKKIKV